MLDRFLARMGAKEHGPARISTRTIHLPGEHVGIGHVLDRIDHRASARCGRRRSAERGTIQTSPDTVHTITQISPAGGVVQSQEQPGMRQEAAHKSVLTKGLRAVGIQQDQKTPWPDWIRTTGKPSRKQPSRRMNSRRFDTVRRVGSCGSARRKRPRSARSRKAAPRPGPGLCGCST